MTSPLIPVRRNSFRRINDAEYLDVTLGEIQDVARENRNGADHIVTEFANGTVIIAEEDMIQYVATLLTLLPTQYVQRNLLGADCSGSYWPTDDLGDDPDGDNT